MALAAQYETVETASASAARPQLGSLNSLFFTFSPPPTTSTSRRRRPSRERERTENETKLKSPTDRPTDRRTPTRSKKKRDDRAAAHRRDGPRPRRKRPRPTPAATSGRPDAYCTAFKVEAGRAGAAKRPSLTRIDEAEADDGGWRRLTSRLRRRCPSLARIQDPSPSVGRLIPSSWPLSIDRSTER